MIGKTFCIIFHILIIGISADTNANPLTDSLWQDQFDLDKKATYEIPSYAEDLNTSWQVVKQAPKDGCFCSTDEVYNGAVCSQAQLDSGCKPIASESYAWGMTRTVDKVFWGTVSNILCQAVNQAYESDSIGCAGDDRDFKMPSVYMYNQKTNVVTSIATNLTGIHYDRLNKTAGLRAAGNRNGVVVLAGPPHSGETLSVYLFAFCSDTGEFLDSMEMEGCDDVRKFTHDVSHLMYVGISLSSGDGLILRYTGSVEQPLQFETVACIDGDPAEVSFYKEYLLVGTWSKGGDLFNTSTTRPARIMVSPSPIDSMEGTAFTTILSPSTTITTTTWRTIWSVDQYEIEPAVVLSYGISANAVVGDWLYWGLVQLQGGGYLSYSAMYGPPVTNQSQTLTMIAVHRATPLFRAKNILSGSLEVQLLYGEPRLTIYDPVTEKWSMAPNAMKQSPMIGRAGFGNPSNVYLWSMALFKGSYLLMGTFDTYAPDPDSESFPYEKINGCMASVFGGDLFVMKVDQNSDQVVGAEWISLDGLGNGYNYGLRNILTDDLYGVDANSSEVMIGTANGYNTNVNGGFQMIKMKISP